ncbi:ATP synthase subunit s, mitochondrial-like [Littorina saxatilis]|uniref:Mitochondrial ATP synthase regulatory component factor B n=1 Tax=Littorina saxatilis TaxID=31220 RepID=A0AAN9BFE5_9CAEN
MMALSAFSRHASIFRAHSCSFVKNVNVCSRQPPVRHFWAWLNSVFNQVDPDRIKQCGPDRACAEWLLRCGASVKWKDKDFWEKDYNLLPGSNYERYKIEGIDATSSAVMAVGFPHLRGLKHVRRIILHDCRYLYDDAIGYLSLVKNTLEFLQLSNCGDITDAGLVPLTELTNLKKLILFSLPEVRDQQKAEAMLKSALPKCDVQFTESRPVEEGEKIESKDSKH